VTHQRRRRSELPVTSYNWYHLRMVKTTVYLPENTKQRVAEAARRSGQSEAEFIRTAIEQRTEEVLPRKRGRWGTVRFDEPGLAHKVDEVLAEGFGQL
jgi:predicted transcriptional regulator